MSSSVHSKDSSEGINQENKYLACLPPLPNLVAMADIINQSWHSFLLCLDMVLKHLPRMLFPGFPQKESPSSNCFFRLISFFSP